MLNDLTAKLACGFTISFIALPSAALSQNTPESELEAALIADDTSALVDIIEEQDLVTPLFIERTPLLHHAVIDGGPEMVSALLEAGLPVDTPGPNGGSALTLAVEMGETETAELLLQHGASRLVLNEVGLTAAEIAALRGDNMLAYHLLPPFTSERTRIAEEWLLHGAAQGDAEAMLLAQSAGADLAARTESGETILQIALAARSWRTIKFIRDQPRSTRYRVLTSDDPRKLLEYALSHSEGSHERRFARQVIEALLRSGGLSITMLKEGLDAFGSADNLAPVLRNVGVAEDVLELYFERREPSLPDLEYSLPRFEPAGGIHSVDWTGVQQVLAAEGLYTGPIDGIPGQGTYDAVSAYILPLAEILIERGRYAAIEARTPSPLSRFGPTTLTRRDGSIVRFRGERTPDYKSIGYFVTHTENRNHFTWSKDPLPSLAPPPGNLLGIFSVYCRDGSVTSISAPLFGSSFTVDLEEDAEYFHYIDDDYYRRSIPLDTEIPCEADDLRQG